MNHSYIAHVYLSSNTPPFMPQSDEVCINRGYLEGRTGFISVITHFESCFTTRISSEPYDQSSASFGLNWKVNWARISSSEFAEVELPGRVDANRTSWNLYLSYS